MKRICSVEGCERMSYARGWCLAHYRRWQYDGDVKPHKPVTVTRRSGRICSVDGCDAPHHAYGYCNVHAMRYQRHGDPLVVMATNFEVFVPSAAKVKPTYQGASFESWARHVRHCNDTQLARLMQRRWRYGSYRPSYLHDGIQPPYGPSWATQRTPDAA